MSIDLSKMICTDADEPVVKRIAMAIAYTWAAQRQEALQEQGLYSTFVATCWEEWVEEARAALKAIREPTPMMFMSGGNSEPYNRAQSGRMRGRRIGDMPAKGAWRLMIDQALKEDVR